MEDKSFTVELKCLFCDCVLEGDIEKEYMSGDMLGCKHCGELNDYDSLMDVAADEGKALVAEHIESEMKKIEKSFSKLFK